MYKTILNEADIARRYSCHVDTAEMGQEWGIKKTASTFWRMKKELRSQFYALKKLDVRNWSKAARINFKDNLL